MSIEVTTLNHTCNVVRRQVQADYKHLRLYFISYNKQEKVEALLDQEENLNSHIAGKAALKHFRRHKNDDKKGFIGLCAQIKKQFFKFKQEPEVIALFYICADDYEYVDDAKKDVYHLTWHAIDLYNHYVKQNGRKYYIEDELITPRYEKSDLLNNNLIADAFTSIALSLQADEDRAIDIAKIRAEVTLGNTPGSKPELYPFPIAFEATQMVYKDLKDIYAGTKMKLMAMAMHMAHEVGITHNEKSLKQWEVFSTSAQEMAWIGYNYEDIISASSYTSEDPYVRTTAYVIADILEIEPKPWDNFKVYNPFADPEMNERAHKKSCDHSWRNVLVQLHQTDDKKPFSHIALQCNKALLEGKVMGWCTPAIMQAAKAYQGETLEEAHSNATKAFEEHLPKIPWSLLSYLSKRIMLLKRDNPSHNIEKNAIDANDLIELCLPDPNLRFMKEALEFSLPSSQEQSLDEKNQGSASQPQEQKQL